MRLLALLAASALALADESCWVGGFSREHCCDPVHGPTGNHECWDDVYRRGYDPCCTSAAKAGTAGAPDGGGVAVLERSLGAKLDGSLAANNATLEEMEADLRQTISTPENRSMAGPISHAYLALVLHRQGRWAEAAEALSKFHSQDFSISANGAWSGTSAEGYHMHDSPFSEALVRFLRSRAARSVVDFGCGLGLYVRDIRVAGIRAGGFDGNPSTAAITEGRCHHLDLSRAFDFGVFWDWVLSMEVAEHIPPEFEDAFIDNLVRHACYGLVLSWGNQGGEGHVNLRPRHEVEAIFAQRGFRSLAAQASELRGAARLPWLQNTVLVLERTAPLAHCGGAAAAAAAPA